MAKYTDAIRDAIIASFNAGDQPTEAQFTNWITRVQEGIEEHDHDGTGDGDGITTLAGVLTLDLANAKVGIGTATPDSYLPTASKLVIYTAAHTGMTIASGTTHEGNIAFADGTVGDDRNRGLVRYSHTDNSLNLFTNAVRRVIINNVGAIQFSDYGAGDLQTDAAGNITAVSDARLKEQIRDTKIGLAEVLQMQGKAWHYTKESGLDTEHWYQGFIADDIEKIVPAAVGQMSDGMKTLSSNSLLPAFAKAIQELDARLTKGGL